MRGGWPGLISSHVRFQMDQGGGSTNGGKGVLKHPGRGVPREIPIFRDGRSPVCLILSQKKWNLEVRQNST